ncbi:MAG: leucyl aminopeptidase [Cryobacterium sp.]
MTVPVLAVSIHPIVNSAADIVVVAAVQSDTGPQLLADPALGALSGQLSVLGVTGAQDELVRAALPLIDGAPARRIAIIGLGRSVSPDALRHAAGSAVRQLTGVDEVAFAVPCTSTEQLAAITEGAALGGYSFTEYRQSSLTTTRLPATRVTVHSGETDESAVTRALIVAQAVSLVKDLVNTPPSDLYPESLAHRAQEAVTDLPIEFTMWDENDLVRDGFGGIAGVGQGSTRPPRLVKLSYSPAGAAQHLALVGKGITFDTGGLSLKPPASMVGMKYDMTGAATVLAVIVAAARLELPVRITAWMCIAENMPSGSAIRPNDVLRMRGGRTVEVLNTDAEGRLVLADGLVAASEEHPDAIIDVATLTGAAIVALGNRYFATMGEDALVQRVLDASRSVNEPAWPMPLPEELRASLTSDVADIANAKIGSSAGGMLLAGIFLQEFVGPRADTTDDTGTSAIPWAHLDIAGPAQNSGGAWGYTAAGPTGVSVRALIRLAEDFSRP